MLDFNGPICAASTSTLADVLVCLFFATRELGFYPFLFFFDTDDDLIRILANSSLMVTVPTGDSCSLEISTVIGSLYMLH